MKPGEIKTAMVLAAGLGTRMRPLTDHKPKPMVEVAGKMLIDRVLDKLAEAGAERAIVNVHYFADLLEAHLAQRTSPAIEISDERDVLLDTGGGVVRALPKLGGAPFFSVNSDTIWIEGATPNFIRLGEAFDADKMDVLLLLAPSAGAIGYHGRGDFHMDADGKLTRRGENEVAPFVFAGAAVLTPKVFGDAPRGAFSLNRTFDSVAATGRLYGLRLDGLWMHVGSPDAIAQAEDAIRAASE